MDRRPLGTFDNAQALTAEQGAYNIVTVARLSSVPDSVRLERALAGLVQRHPMLRARIVTEKGRVLEESAASALPLEYLESTAEDAWIGLTEKELVESFDLSQPPLGRCLLLVNSTKQSADLILTFPHTMVDGVAVTHLVNELLRLLAGHDVTDLPTEKGLPASCDDLFPRRWQWPRRLPSSARFLVRQLSGELVYRARTRGRHSKPAAGPFRNRILPLALTEGSTTALIRASRRRRVSVVALLEAAMLIAVVRSCYPNLRMPHRYCAFPLLRQYLEPPVGDDVVACYITVLRLTAEVAGDDDLWGLARRINSDLDQSMRRGERFLASVWSHFSMRAVFSQQSHRMSTTALSYTGATNMSDVEGVVDVREIHAFVSNFPIGPQFTGQSRIFRGRLWLDLLYLDSDLTDAEARAIADTMRQLLIDAPTATSEGAV